MRLGGQSQRALAGCNPGGFYLRRSDKDPSSLVSLSKEAVAESGLGVWRVSDGGLTGLQRSAESGRFSLKAYQKEGYVRHRSF